MIYLSGHASTHMPFDARLGLLIQPSNGYRSQVARAGVWGADTGLYRKDPASFDVPAFLAWLEPLRPHRDRCAFVTAPDAYADAETTLRLSVPAAALIREAGWPVALVAQDGMTPESVPWSAFDARFIGGTTEWKLSKHAAELAREAKARGLWLHMGRVNSRRRWTTAAMFGCDSVDGTYLAFGPDQNLPKLLRWGNQGVLGLGG